MRQARPTPRRTPAWGCASSSTPRRCRRTAAAPARTIARLGVSIENTAAAESRIRDTDMAAGTTVLTRVQVLAQAGTAMLAQADQTPQCVLKLLG
ncbi:flagellin [Modestobacter sp. SYSU DS0875]